MGNANLKTLAGVYDAVYVRGDDGIGKWSTAMHIQLQIAQNGTFVYIENGFANDPRDSFDTDLRKTSKVDATNATPSKVLKVTEILTIGMYVTSLVGTGKIVDIRNSEDGDIVVVQLSFGLGFFQRSCVKVIQPLSNNTDDISEITSTVETTIESNDGVKLMSAGKFAGISDRIRVLVSVREGVAEIQRKGESFTKLGLDCNLEAEKVMELRWHDTPPFAGVIQESVCALNPPFKINIRVVNKGTSLTYRKGRLAVKLYKTGTAKWETEVQPLWNKLQQLTATPLQRVPIPIEKQLTLPGAIDHYKKLINSMTMYDPSVQDNIGLLRQQRSLERDMEISGAPENDMEDLEGSPSSNLLIKNLDKGGELTSVEELCIGLNALPTGHRDTPLPPITRPAPVKRVGILTSKKMVGDRLLLNSRKQRSKKRAKDALKNESLGNVVLQAPPSSFDSVGWNWSSSAMSSPKNDTSKIESPINSNPFEFNSNTNKVTKTDYTNQLKSPNDETIFDETKRRCKTFKQELPEENTSLIARSHEDAERVAIEAEEAGIKASHVITMSSVFTDAYKGMIGRADDVVGVLSGVAFSAEALVGLKSSKNSLEENMKQTKDVNNNENTDVVMTVETPVHPISNKHLSEDGQNIFNNEKNTIFVGEKLEELVELEDTWKMILSEEERIVFDNKRTVLLQAFAGCGNLDNAEVALPIIVAAFRSLSASFFGYSEKENIDKTGSAVLTHDEGEVAESCRSWWTVECIHDIINGDTIREVDAWHWIRAVYIHWRSAGFYADFSVPPFSER